MLNCLLPSFVRSLTPSFIHSLIQCHVYAVPLNNCLINFYLLIVVLQEGADDCNSFPCQHDGTCAATSTGYKCTCATGWFGNNCENSVNNCQPTSPCINGGTCLNTVSDYKCQ